MRHYKGQIWRQSDNTPTKNSWPSKQIQHQQPKYEISQSYCESKSYSNYEHNHTDKHYKNSKYDIKTIYNNNIPVRIKTYEKQDYSTILRLELIQNFQNGMRNLTIHLTDDNKPKFLWTFRIKQPDFPAYKEQQRLKVDFGNFPQMLREHLLYCESQKHKDESKIEYHCIFEITKQNEGYILIIEGNHYKQNILVHLRARIGDDEQIKDYLSGKLIKAGQEINSLYEKMSDYEEKLTVRIREYEELNIEYRNEMECKNKIISTLQVNQRKKYNQLKETNINQEEVIKKQFQKEKMQIVNALEDKITILANRLEEMQSKYDKANNRVYQLESLQRDLKSKLAIVQRESQKNQNQANDLRKINKTLEEKKYQNQRTITELQCKVQGLIRQIDDKNVIINSTIQLKSNTTHQIQQLQDKNKEQSREINRMRQKIQELQNIQQKSIKQYNQLRTKLQKRKDKLISRNEIIKIQQKKIQQNQNNILQLKKYSKKIKSQFQNKQLQCQQKINKIQQIQKSLQQSNKNLQMQKDVILNLQKQFNDRTIGIKTLYNGYNNSYNNYTNSYSGTSPYNSTISLSRQCPSPNSIEMKSKYKSNDSDNKIQPTIKRYTGFNDNRSKSPKSFQQQNDPQDQNIIKPVKFKNKNLH